MFPHCSGQSKHYGVAIAMTMLPTIHLPYLILWLSWSATPASALVQTLCSSQNTGENSELSTFGVTPLMQASVDFAKCEHHVVSNEFQSNGRCHTTCQANYAFAIVQYTSCWCSNYAPADTLSVSSCGKQCPGYPPENCGDQQAGLFGYIALNKSPSGTIGAATSSSTATSASMAAVAVSTVHAVSVFSVSVPLVQH